MDATRPRPAESKIRDAVRVLYLLDDTRKGRTVSDLVKLLKRLKRMQFTAAVCSVSPHEDGTEKIQGQDIPVISLDAKAVGGPKALFTGLAALQRLRALLVKFRPDILHVCGPRARTLAALAAAPEDHIAVVESPGGEDDQRGFARMAEGLALKMGVRPVRIVEDDADVDSPRDVAIPTGIDISAARSALAIGPETLPLDRYYVGVTVRPGATDATRRMLEAFSVFAPCRDDATLVVLATRDVAHLEPWTDDLGLSGRVFCVPPPPEPSSVLQRLDVLWVPGMPDPDRRWILEAMTVGTPVVCDYRTSLAQEIREIGGALMRDEEWSNQFAEATRELASDNELAQNLARAGRALVDARYNMKARAERLRDLYDELS